MAEERKRREGDRLAKANLHVVHVGDETARYPRQPQLLPLAAPAEDLPDLLDVLL
jgi:hypothetical protein